MRVKSEECDDGGDNGVAKSGDGCSDKCKIEFGYLCTDILG